MRVGLAIQTDSPGGAETMMLELTRELLARGHQVVALGLPGGEGWLTAQFAAMGVPRELIEFDGFYGLGAVPKIASVIRAQRLDVLHTHDFGMALQCALAARIAGCRHVITMHGGLYYSDALRRRLALRLATAMSRRIVAVSYAARERLSQALRLRQDSIAIILNGVGDRPYQGGRARDELGLAEGDVLVLAVGNLLPVKGHSVLIEALARLGRTDHRVVVAIAGRGPEEARLRSLAAGLGVESDVRFLGYRSDVPELLGAADVFVMPSLSEGLPMAMIEAMLAGKAILASDAGGIRELLTSADLGQVVPPGDPDALSDGLRELIGNGDLRRRLGTAARSRAVDHFTASAMAEKYVSLYAE